MVTVLVSDTKLALCDGNFPAQPISVQKIQSRGNPHKPLHTSWISQHVSVMFANQKTLLIVTIE